MPLEGMGIGCIPARHPFDRRFEVIEAALLHQCRKLGAKGIKTTPYRRLPGLNNIGTASMVDPWGVSIELTEGLDRIR